MPEKTYKSFILDNLQKAEKKQFETENSYDGQLVENDFIKAITRQYELEIQAGINLIKEYKSMQKVMLTSFSKDENGKTVQSGGCIINMSLWNQENISVNDFIREVRGKYWTALFDNDKFVGKLTKNLKIAYTSKIEELKNYDFSEWNIREIQIQMTKDMSKGIEDTIVELFDELSHKHHWYDETSKNIHYFDGWKTNKSWIINKKVILPLDAYRYSYFSNKKELDFGYDFRMKLMDIEKCLNYLDGGITESMDLNDILLKAKKENQSKNILTKYFNITVYKKGTCHITFRNPELLKKFNIFGAQHKRWLPPAYGKKKYNEMNEEEKSVIDEFEGKASYENVLQKKDYYICKENGLCMLEQAS